MKSKSITFPRSILALLLFLLVGGTLAAGYQTTLTPVTLVVDEQSWSLNTSQDTVGALLLDVGLDLHPEDQIDTDLSTQLVPEMTIHIRRARPVEIHVDGQQLVLRTHATSAEDVLA